MNKSKYEKKSQHSSQNALFYTVSVILILTMLSVWFVSGLYAKYVITDTYSDSAGIAAASGSIELWEHKAKLNSGIYELDETSEVKKNRYRKVIPGVDIAKDPFVRINIDSEVSYNLYIKIVEEDLPEKVTYKLTDDWEEFDKNNGIYKYKNVFEAGTKYENKIIKILKGDKLIVSDHYVGTDEDGELQPFTLTFSAWLEQAAN